MIKQMLKFLINDKHEIQKPPTLKPNCKPSGQGKKIVNIEVKNV